MCHCAVGTGSDRDGATQLLWTELVYPLGQKLCFIHLYRPQNLSQYFRITEVIPLHETSGVEDKKLRRNLSASLNSPTD